MNGIAHNTPSHCRALTPGLHSSPTFSCMICTSPQELLTDNPMTCPGDAYSSEATSSILRAPAEPLAAMKTRSDSAYLSASLEGLSSICSSVGDGSDGCVPKLG